MSAFVDSSIALVTRVRIGGPERGIVVVGVEEGVGCPDTVGVADQAVGEVCFMEVLLVLGERNRDGRSQAAGVEGGCRAERAEGKM